MLIHGSCHCGNIAFDLTWDPDPVEIPARACDCSFCVKHGGVWTSNPNGALTVHVKDPHGASKYAFGTHTADFHICKVCGIAPVVTSQIDGELYAVVSVNAFDNVERSRLKPAPISYEGEEQGTRVARRKRNWIPSVRFL